MKEKRKMMKKENKQDYDSIEEQNVRERKHNYRKLLHGVI